MKAEPEFGNKEGMKILNRKALHGLKTSVRKFWELLAGMLKKIGFTPIQHGNKVWIKSI